VCANIGLIEPFSFRWLTGWVFPVAFRLTQPHTGNRKPKNRKPKTENPKTEGDTNIQEQQQQQQQQQLAPTGNLHAKVAKVPAKLMKAVRPF